MGTQDKKKAMAKITTPEFRVSYPNVWEARSWKGGKAKFGVQMLFPKATDIKALRKLVRKTLDAAFGPFEGDDATKWPEGFKNPIKNGDGKKYAGKGRKECKDHYVINANSDYKPGLVEPDGVTPIEDKSDFYPGCYARAQLFCYAFDVSGNQGVTFGLNHIQKLRNGKALGGPGSVDGVFDAVESTEEDDYGNEEEESEEDESGGF